MSQPPSRDPGQGPWNGGRPPMIPPPPTEVGPPGGTHDPEDSSGSPPSRDPRGPGRASPWLWIGLGCGGLFVLGVVLVVLIAFVLDDRGQDGDAPESGGTGAPTTTAAPRMNDTVEHDGILFTVTDTEVTDEIGDHSPLGEYLIVHIDVANAGVDEFWRDEQHVYTSSGERVEEDYGATLKLKSPIWQDLPVDGTPVGVSIAFDVESASDVSHIGLSSRFRGGNEIKVALGD